MQPGTQQLAILRQGAKFLMTRPLWVQAGASPLAPQYRATTLEQDIGTLNALFPEEVSEANKPSSNNS